MRVLWDETLSRIALLFGDAESEAGLWVAITAAARQALRVREGLSAVAEWEAEHGALTEDDLEAARQRLNRNSARPKRRLKKRPAP